MSLPGGRSNPAPAKSVQHKDAAYALSVKIYIDPHIYLDIQLPPTFLLFHLVQLPQEHLVVPCDQFDLYFLLHLGRLKNKMCVF